MLPSGVNPSSAAAAMYSTSGYFLQEVLIAQNKGSLVYQPGGFDVVPIGDNAVFTNPIIIEEQFQMTGLDIQNPFREKAYQIAQLPLQTGILPHAEKIGIKVRICRWVFIVLRSFSSLALRRMSAISPHSRVKASQ